MEIGDPTQLFSARPGPVGRTPAVQRLPQHAGIGGIVLAGVHAWGNSLLEQIVCRPLLPVAQQPLVWHALRWMRQGGVLQATICGNSDTNRIHQTLGDGRTADIHLDYYEDLMPRGPAGCIRDAAAQSSAETIVVVEGTLLPQLDLAELLRVHREGQAILTVAVCDDQPTPGRPFATCEPLGIYVFSRAVLEHIPEHGYQDIKEGLIPRLYAMGVKVITCPVSENGTRRVSSASSYLGANMAAIKRLMSGPVPQDYQQRGSAWIHDRSTVDPTVRFVGPVVVGPDTVIEARAIVVGPTTIGRGCYLESEAIISRCAVWDRCHICASAALDHCVVAEGCRVLSGVSLRNAVRLAAPPVDSWWSRLAGRFRLWAANGQRA